MSTVTLNAYSKAYPFITNRIKASVLSATSPFAVVASIIDTTVGHPIRTYDFLGLPRANYGFSLDEIDGGGAVVNNLALFSVVPSSLGDILSRDDEQPQVDITLGFVSGTTSFTFDGTAGKPDYIGWEIVPSELTGRGILVEGTDYSWDAIIGEFNLLLPGDKFNAFAFWNIHFNPINVTAGNSVPTVNDFQINFIDSDTVLDETYFGKKLIIEPIGAYTEVTLPNIATVVEGRRMMVEVSGAGVAAVKFLTFGSDTINFLRGNLIAMINESFSIYAFEHPVNGREWRIYEAEGNFKTAGESVYDDAIQADVYNKILLSGASLNRYQYSRLYEEFVLNLPVAQTVAYDSHGTGNNKYLWGLANSADPGNVDKFLIPDRRNMFVRNNSSGKAGDYFDDTIKTHNIPLPNIWNESGTGHLASGGNYNEGAPVDTLTYTGGTETKPKNILNNQYVRI